MILAALSLSAILASNSPIIQTPARNVAPAGGGGAVNLSYDFTGADNAEWNTATFTEVDGNVNILSNEGRFVEGGFDSILVVTDTPTSTIDQYQRFVLKTIPGNSYLQAVFRYTDSSSPFYVVQIDIGNSFAGWYRYANLSDYQAGTSSTIKSDVALPASLVANEPVAITLTGTGTSTVVRIWRNPTGNTPTAANNWGGDTTPDLEFTDDPASAVNTGGVMGLGIYQNTANAQRIDDWYAGDVP
jgi:hypothetical protein